MQESDGSFVGFLTVVYAHNQLDKRRTLWRDIANLAPVSQGPWMIIGDFNNVLTVDDRIGGSPVQAYEYADLAAMMDVAGFMKCSRMGVTSLGQTNMTTG